MDLADASAVDLLALYRRREASPLEATRAALARIDACDRFVNAFCLVDETAALAAARASEARWAKGEPCGLLDGVPTAIKDIVLTRGWPTLRGSRTVDPAQPWEDDAPAVARLREHGAVLLGKTTTPEFGWKGVTDCALTGVTRNPWNPARTTGGSSGGAVAACALGMGALHIGTDGGGSIRIPAGFTGVFGLKPSFGRVPAWPASPFGTVAHLGPIARTVTDAALMLNVLSLPDARDWLALPHEARDYRVGLDGGVAGLRVALSVDLGYAKVDPDVEALVRAAAGALAGLGAHVEEIEPPFDNPHDVFCKHWFAAAAKMLEPFDEARLALIEPGLREIAARGAAIPLGEYLQATLDRAALGVRMSRFHERYDLLLTPALPIPAFEAGAEYPADYGDGRWVDWTPFTYPFNLTGQPACSVPCGLSRDGLPIGLQIVGPAHHDARVLRAARAFESTRPIPRPDRERLAAAS